MKLNGSTTLFYPDQGGTPVEYALKALRKDWRRIFDAEPPDASGPRANQICLLFAHDLPEEGLRLSQRAGDEHLSIEGADDLGLVFGIYYLCEHILGVDPYEFWTDFPYPHLAELEVAPFFTPRHGPRSGSGAGSSMTRTASWPGMIPLVITLSLQEQI